MRLTLIYYNEVCNPR